MPDLTDDYLLMLDLETTGLDPSRDSVLEYAMVLVDANDLTVLWSDTQLIATRIPLNQMHMSPYVRNMHTNSGLLAEHMGHKGPLLPLEETLARALGMMTQHWLPSERLSSNSVAWATLCGYSIHFDRGFLKQQAPNFEAKCSHRMLDVSTLRRCTKQWAPNLLREAVGAQHRALVDCLDALDELRPYRKLFLAQK